MTYPPDPARGYAQRALVVSSVVALVGGLLLLAWHVAQVILLIFGGILFGVFLRGLANPLTRHTRLPDGASLVLVVLALLLFVLGALAALAPQTMSGIEQLAEELPRALERLRQALQAEGWAQSTLDWIAQSGAGELSPDALVRVAGVFSTAFGAVAGVLIIFALGTYFAVSPKLYTKGLLHLVPLAHQRRGAEFLSALAFGLRWWLIGQLGSMTVVGVLITLGLFALEVPAALTLGLFAGLLTFIPFLGPIFSAVPAVLIALVESPVLAVYVVLLYTFVQTLEGYLVTPLIQRRTVYMPPALLLIAQAVLGVWLGFLGVLLATPVILVVLITVQMLYVEDALGQRVREVWETGE